MAWSRKSRKTGERVVRRVRPDGSVKEYRYAKYTPKKRETGDTIEGLIDAYRSSPEWAALSASTQAGRTGYLKLFDVVRTVPVASVKRRDLIAMHDALRTAKGNGSANGFLAAAKALFAWAVEKEWIEILPTLRIKAAPGGHHRAWTVAEADRAERLLPEHLRRVIVLARHTGQRRGDLCSMLWSAYDGQTIRVVQQKSKPGAAPVKLVIPVNVRLRAEIDAWKQKSTAVTILTNAAGKPWIAQSLSHVLPLALEKIGLSGELNVHGLRKLAAAELANAGCSPHEIAAITGHRTLGMVELYTRSVDQERLANAAVLRLADYKVK